jgi:hypothetical protein
MDQIHPLLLLLLSAAVEEQPHRAQAHLADPVVVVDTRPVQAELAQQVKVITAALADPVVRNLLPVAAVVQAQ